MFPVLQDDFSFRGDRQGMRVYWCVPLCSIFGNLCISEALEGAERQFRDGLLS
jgi:hypothetical protein